jgi:hypothetical protein
VFKSVDARTTESLTHGKAHRRLRGIRSERAFIKQPSLEQPLHTLFVHPVRIGSGGNRSLAMTCRYERQGRYLCAQSGQSAHSGYWVSAGARWPESISIGTVLHKMGAATGWTTGNLTVSRKDYFDFSGERRSDGIVMTGRVRRERILRR